MKMRTIASVAAACLLSITACGDPRTVTGPSPARSGPPAPAPAPDPPPPQPAAATLVVSSFDVEFQEVYGGSFWYFPAMVLTETTGQSAAALKSIVFSTADGQSFPIVNDAPPGMGCFLTNESKSVAAGASWDLSSVYGYCLDIDSRTDLSGREVTVVVTFTDEDGHVGTTKGVATVK